MYCGMYLWLSNLKCRCVSLSLCLSCRKAIQNINQKRNARSLTISPCASLEMYLYLRAYEAATTSVPFQFAQRADAVIAVRDSRFQKCLEFGSKIKGERREHRFQNFRQDRTENTFQRYAHIRCAFCLG